MSYFIKFPTVLYEFPDDIIREYTDISIRPAVVEKLLSTPGALENYQVRDGDTPETIAYDLYGDPAMHWVIMLANEVMNLYTDWPLAENVLRKVVEDKYRTYRFNDSDIVLSDVELYEFLEFEGTTTEQFISWKNDSEYYLHPHHFVDDAGNYYSWGSHTNTVDAWGRTIDLPTLTPVSHWDYEVDKNEKNRYIFVPTVKTANKMIRELRDLVNG